MITKEQKRRLGVFTVASLILLLVLVGLLVVPSLQEAGVPYTINVKGASVYGLSIGASVKYQGVEVGQVSRILVNPYDLNSILVQVRIGRRFPVRQGMLATLTYAGITGQKYIDLKGGDITASRLPTGSEIEASRGLGEKAEDIVSDIEQALRSANDLLSEENRKRINQFLASTQQSAEVVSRVLQGKEQNLSRAILNIEKAANDFGAVTENLRQITANLTRLTDRLGENVNTTWESINRRFSDEELGKVLRNLEAFIAEASSGLKKVEGVVSAQQEDLRDMIAGLASAIDNLARLARDVIEDPRLFLRTSKGKK